jgi:hypothetical protein
MNKRPISVALVACVYIATGALGIAFHLTELNFQYDTILVLLVRLLAIISGVYMLRGSNWARWLALAWIAFHVIISALHTMSELAMHCLICALLTYLLTRPNVAAYFGARGTQATR